MEKDRGWGWLSEDRRPLCGCLIFARDVTPEHVIQGFGLDSSSARMVDEDHLGSELPFPVHGQDSGVAGPYVRAGRAGRWAFAIDQAMLSLSLAVKGRNIAKRLSAGTETVVVSWTAKPTEDIEYWADGVLMTSFEPYMAWYRTGDEPDRFLREMQEAGLVTEPPPEEPPADEEEPPMSTDSLVAALDMLTLALGIRLPEEVVSGPLLTVQRAPDGTSPGG
jgi:hypothetical protein